MKKDYKLIDCLLADLVVSDSNFSVGSKLGGNLNHYFEFLTHDVVEETSDDYSFEYNSNNQIVFKRPEQNQNLVSARNALNTFMTSSNPNVENVSNVSFSFTKESLCDLNVLNGIQNKSALAKEFIVSVEKFNSFNQLLQSKTAALAELSVDENNSKEVITNLIGQKELEEMNSFLKTISPSVYLFCFRNIVGLTTVIHFYLDDYIDNFKEVQDVLKVYGDSA